MSSVSDAILSKRRVQLVSTKIVQKISVLTTVQFAPYTMEKLRKKGLFTVINVEFAALEAKKELSTATFVSAV